MSLRVKPAFLLGIGKQGSEIARAIHEVLLANAGSASAIISCICLDEQGAWTIGGSGEVLARCAGLRAEVGEGIRTANFAVFQQAEDSLIMLFADRISALLRQDFRADLRDKGFVVSEGVEVWVCASLSDPLGSAGIIPVLASLLALQAGRLRGTLFETQVLGFFPDLFPEDKDSEAAYALAYTCLRELNFVANHPDRISASKRSPFSNVYLFSTRNEDGVAGGTYLELAPMVGEVLSNLLMSKIASDQSFTLALLKNVQGHISRYSSLGLSKLVLPKAKVMRAIADHTTLVILGLRDVPVGKVFGKDAVEIDVRKFIIENGLDRVIEKLRLDSSGKTIWREFKYEGALNEGVIIDNFLQDIGEQASDFDRRRMTEMIRILGERRASLQNEKRQALLSGIERRLDDASKGLYQARAFLELLQGESSKYTCGEDPIQEYSLERLERDAKKIFDARKDLDRSELRRLKQDLDAKREALEACLSKLEGSSLKALANSETGGEIAAVSPVPIGNEADRLKDLCVTLAQEYKSLEAKYGVLAAKAEEIDRILGDVVQRSRFFQEIRHEELPDKEQLDGDARQIDEKYREGKRKLNSLYEERRRVVQKLAFLLPGVGTALYLLLASLVWHFTRPESFLGGFKIAGGLYLLALVAYAIWAWNTYRTGIGAQVENAEVVLENLRGQKVAALLAIQQYYNRGFQLAFEQAVQIGLIEFLHEFKLYTQELCAQVVSFTQALKSLAGEKKKAFDELSFPNTVFSRNVVARADVERFIASNRRMDLEKAMFFNRKPLATYFEEFRNSGQLHGLLADVDAFTEEIFDDLRKLSIEDFLKNETAAGRLRAADKISGLYDSTKAFVLLDVERGEDGSQALVYVGVYDSSDSLAKTALQSQGHTDVNYYSTGNDTEIVVTRLKVGFPAFHVALVQYGRTLLNKLGENTFAMNPDWMAADLMPSLYTLGAQDDPVRQIFCLGRVFSLITAREGCYYLEGQRLGTTEREAVETLRSFAANALRDRLLERIEAAKQEPDALDALVRYREAKGVDDIDRSIVDRVISQISSLA